MIPPKVQPRREPPTDVNAPVNFLHEDDVNRKSNENSRADPQFEQHFTKKSNKQAVQYKSRENQWRRSAEI